MHFLPQQVCIKTFRGIPFHANRPIKGQVSARNVPKTAAAATEGFAHVYIIPPPVTPLIVYEHTTFAWHIKIQQAQWRRVHCYFKLE